jgi:phosphoribosyl 1,2-cyclic phosphate phosphodiesterase
MYETRQHSDLLFIGSGAADWPLLEEGVPFPQPFVHRSNAALVVDGHVLIDCGPQTMTRLAALGCQAEHITDLMITHSHSDHYDADQVYTLANVIRPASLRIWYPAGVELSLASFKGIDLHPLHPGDMAVPSGYAVLALAANHPVRATGEIPLAYLFDNGACRWLYATDGAWFNAYTWRCLCDEVPFNALIIDCTLGKVTDDWRVFEHNSLAMVKQIVTIMRHNGLLTPAAQVILTHLARETHLPHLKLTHQVANDGLTVAYDGLKMMVSGDTHLNNGGLGS